MESERTQANGGWHELGEVLWLSLPIIISMISVTVMNFVSVLMVGRHSADELAAITPAWSVFFLVIMSFLMGTLSITNTYVAQCVGRGEKREAPSYVWQSVYLSILWGIVALPGIFFAPAVFSWTGQSALIQAHEASYFQISLFSIPGFGAWIAVSAFYQATNRPVVSMAVGVVGNVFNLACNYVLIFGKWGFPEMGMEGAAVSMVVTMYLQTALLLCVFLAGASHREYGTRHGLGLNLRKLWQIIRYGVPAGVGWALDHGSWTVFFLGVVGPLGEAAQAATNVAACVAQFSFMPVWGLNVGVQAVVGQRVGMRDLQGARRRAYRALGVAVAYMTFMGVMMIVFREPLMRMFVGPDASAALVAEIIRMGSVVLVFAALYQAFDAVTIITYGALMGAGDTRVPTLITIVCNWFVFIPLALLLTRVFKQGIVGAWTAVTVTMALIGILTFWRFASGAWRKIDMFEGKTPVDVDMR